MKPVGVNFTSTMASSLKSFLGVRDVWRPRNLFIGGRRREGRQGADHRGQRLGDDPAGREPRGGPT